MVWDLENWAHISTIILAIAAIAAGFLAWWNLGVLREQIRLNTFLSLINETSNERARANRNIIHECVKPDANGLYPTEIPKHQVYSFSWGQIGSRELISAIEETIVCLDKAGFFLLQGDPRLKNKAPMWIWTITSEMWEKLGAYVKARQNRQSNYGKYFKELADVASIHQTENRGAA